MKKNLKLILVACLIGFLIGNYIFNEYKNNSINVMKTEENNIYLMQYGVYKNKTNMLESTTNLKNYLYYKENNKYHVIIGIVKDKKLKDKILNAYKIDNIYMKKIKMENIDFLSLLDQYDELVRSTTEDDIILSSQKQILSKYEELYQNYE